METLPLSAFSRTGPTKRNEESGSSSKAPEPRSAKDNTTEAENGSGLAGTQNRKYWLRVYSRGSRRRNRLDRRNEGHRIRSTGHPAPHRQQPLNQLDVQC